MIYLTLTNCTPTSRHQGLCAGIINATVVEIVVIEELIEVMLPLANVGPSIKRLFA